MLLQVVMWIWCVLIVLNGKGRFRGCALDILNKRTMRPPLLLAKPMSEIVSWLPVKDMLEFQKVQKSFYEDIVPQAFDKAKSFPKIKSDASKVLSSN